MATLRVSNASHYKSLPVRYRTLSQNPFFSVILLCCIFAASCTKIKGTDIGADLLPAVDNVITFDTTLEVIASVFPTEDSLLPRLNQDYNGTIGDLVLGQITNDPQFGKSSASMFFELKPPSYPYYFENTADSLYLDSAVLCLKWTHTFGDTNAIQTVNVHRVAETLRTDTIYSTGKTVRYGDLIGTKSFAPKELNDSLYLFRQTINNQLRIKLNQLFAKSLLAFDTSTRSPYYNDTAFRNIFKGFAVVPQSGTSANALMSFDISDTSTHLRIYYRYDKNGKRDTTYRDFEYKNLNTGAAINNIARSYNGSEAARHLGVRPRGDSLVYIQADPGTYALLRLPALTEFASKKGNVMIHLAQLKTEEVVTAGRQPNVFSTPNFLYLERLDSPSTVIRPFFTDAYLGGKYEPFVFGGQRKLITDASNAVVSTYDFNITRYIQGIITRKEPNLTLKLHAPHNVQYNDLLVNFVLNGLGRGHVVLGGGNHAQKRMKVRVVYSKL
ncbi:MAG: DUF4270 domain-containing protein [Bacteroidetes bacterium]|nr:DUF4270 domain-containing protein [Bacteroidota bacterium]